MKLILAAAAVFALASVSAPAAAQARHDSPIEIHAGAGDSPARPGQRHDLRDARVAIDTRGGEVTLLLTDEVVAMQLTERMLRDISRDMEEEQEGGFFARLVSSAVQGTVQSVVRRSMEVPLREIRGVDYRNGRLVFTTRDGETAFEHVKVNGDEMMDSFSPADARAFVREFNALRARRR